ncbi:putative phosphoglycerate mutase [Sphingomonas sp. PP-F2F-G114-C0414]|uniref:histidine phosphatase family protein n=1 Tax=Sphingomonas sp. PP-F2F-G114-C0414 TaxID=2135662 RepID=UPI000EF92A64|nr:histidine phosphatase family protein [Sphingomonas sp. PP-F2F-G114-C0414]RMB25768.1 putative phosphoglycerate mutase [Sphingomonas sp. PP-F2F-G114-C0414]
MTRTFVIVRHGNTFADHEAPRRIGARTDLPLVASGHEQARRLGGYFAEQGWRFDTILCSPLLRTRETAEAIRGAFDDAPTVTPAPLLAEIDHGPDEDRIESEVIARIGSDALAAWETHGIAPPGWGVDAAPRLAGWRALFAEQAFAEQAGSTTLLVTSNGAARFALLADAALITQADVRDSLKLRTGAFGIIRNSDAGLQLLDWDRRP